MANARRGREKADVSQQRAGKRQSIIEACRSMNALGINQGTSWNISLRHDDGLLITPTSVPYETMQPEQIVFMDLDGSFDPAQRPSQRVAVSPRYPQGQARGQRRGSRPSALFDDPCHHGSGNPADPLHDRMCRRRHASAARSRDVRHAGAFRARRARRSRDRLACLLEHHGMIAIGPSLSKAMWLAVEVEALARQYHGCLQIGTPRLPSRRRSRTFSRRTAGYGPAGK